MSRAQTLAALGEFGFLDRLLPTLKQRPDVLVGPGDDCAVVRCGNRRVLITTDALVESVHFERDWMTPHQLGRRSFLVNLSDIAAMGGRPTFCVISAGVPVSYPARDLTALHAGIQAAAQEAGAAVVGGNISRADRLFISITLLGEVGDVVTRRGARAGDELFVTGTLGDAALGVKQLQRGRSGGHAIQRYREPQPRVAVGVVLARRLASAMIDISDGLLQDLGHVTQASHVGAEIDVEALPYSAALRRLPAAEALQLALRGGDDYELLCAVPPRRVPALLRLRKQLGCQITRIGRCVSARKGIEMLGAGREVHVDSGGGWDHFVTRVRGS
ncbi:MAG TPA: thiamine-phosphate kinase [Candidatus Kryptonia bacterium]|nr:thiamine-phosphate kinase [Candidatus Kryptonia bacterium]